MIFDKGWLKFIQDCLDYIFMFIERNKFYLFLDIDWINNEMINIYVCDSFILREMLVWCLIEIRI